MHIGAWAAAAPSQAPGTPVQQRAHRTPGHARTVLLVPRVASGHVAADGTPSSTQAVLDRYQALLREYRLHKQALGGWFSGVLSQQRRPPQLLDAQATGDEALVARFQQYLMVRKRLLAEIPLLREQLDEAMQQDTAHHGSSGGSSGSSASAGSSTGSKHHKHHRQGVNANQATPVTRGQAVGQFFAAVNYRQQQGVRNAAAAAAAAAASAAESESPEVAQAAAAVAALVSRHAAAADAAIAAAAPPAAAADNAEAAASHILSAATSSSSSSGGGAAGASSRAAAAAMAALAYKQGKKAGGSSAAVDGPATTLGGSSRQQRPLAIQMAEPPAPPPGYQATSGGMGAAAAAAGGDQQQQGPMVEAGQVDAVYARAPRRALDSDLSLEATLQGVPGGLGGEQLFAATKVLSADAAVAAAPPAAAAAASGKGQESASHMLSAAINSSSGSSGKVSAASSRASAAALAALAYKQGKQAGSSTSADSGSRQQRPLAMQLAAAPEPPPGYDPSAAAAAGQGPMVEAGQMDAVYARAPRRTLDSDLSLEATLQGVPGGLGGEQLFAATTVLEGDPSAAGAAALAAADSASPASSSSSSAPQPQPQEQQQPAGQVLTAKFDVYSGRRRTLDGSQLDDFLAGLSEAYSTIPAAAAAASGSVPGSSAEAGNVQPSGAVMDKSKQQPQPQQQRAGFGGDDSSDGPVLPPDIIPVPT